MKSGIYSFKSITNGRMYIGLSCDVYYRKRKHIELLKRGAHCNCHLQAHFNKYGEQDLQFEIIEHCPVSDLEAREMYWIDKLGAYGGGFNQTKGGHLKDYASRLFSFENIKTGEVVEDISVKDFSDRENLDGSTVYKLIRGKINTSLGWKMKGKILPTKRAFRPNQSEWKKIELKNIKTGEIFKFDSQTMASITLGIPCGSLSNLERGKLKSCRGFILLKNDGKPLITKSQKNFILNHPKHGEFSGFSQGEFCNKYNLNAGMVSCLIGGKIKKYRGWENKTEAAVVSNDPC
jgi:group I intron endonuclease